MNKFDNIFTDCPLCNHKVILLDKRIVYVNQHRNSNTRYHSMLISIYGYMESYMNALHKTDSF